MSQENADKAMAFLKTAAKQRPYTIIPYRPLGNYWLVKREKWFGFALGSAGPLVAVCSIRLMQFSPIPIAQFFFIAVEPEHRGKRLASALVHSSLAICNLIDESGRLRYGLASMPDGEPEFVRKYLVRLGCKPTKGFNTDGHPMLYARHPYFVGDDTFTDVNYLLEPPEEAV